MSKKIESFRANLMTLAVDHATKAETHKAAAMEGGDNAAAETAKAKRHATHARYDERVAGMTDAAVAVAFRFGMTAENVNAQSREYKKRIIGICEAIASGSRSRIDNAADAMIQAMIASDAESFSLDYLAKQANHETTAQAGYMRTALTLLGAADKVKGALILKRESKAWQAIVTLYGKLPAPPAEIVVNE
jgi:hypothetical protein